MAVETKLINALVKYQEPVNLALPQTFKIFMRCPACKNSNHALPIDLSAPFAREEFYQRIILESLNKSINI